MNHGMLESQPAWTDLLRLLESNKEKLFVAATFAPLVLFTLVERDCRIHFVHQLCAPIAV